MKTIIFSLLFIASASQSALADGPSNSLALTNKQKSMINILKEIKNCPMEFAFSYDDDSCVLPAAETASLSLQAVYGENDPVAKLILNVNKCVIVMTGGSDMRPIKENAMDNDCYKPIVDAAINLVKLKP